MAFISFYRRDMTSTMMTYQLLEGTGVQLVSGLTLEHVSGYRFFSQLW